MTLLSAWDLLLSRLAGQDDVVVGTPIAGRNIAEVENLVGFFLNTLVLRVDLSSEDGSLNFNGLIDRVKETTLAAYEHQAMPFTRLVEELQPERDMSRNPLFQVFFNMVNLPEETVELPDLSMTPEAMPNIGSKFDMTLYVKEVEEGIDFDLHYNSDLFDEERMRLVIEQYSFILEQVANAPEQSIDAISITTPAMSELLPDPQMPLDDAWNGAVTDQMARIAANHPEQIALISSRGEWTYQQLNQRVNQMAHWLLSHVGKEDVVAIYGARHEALVCAVLGSMKAGAAYVILDPLYPAPRLNDILEVAQPKVLITIKPAGVLPSEVDAFLSDDVIRLTYDIHEETETDSYSTEDPQISITADQLAYLAFTSGSTGKPKGVEGRHGPLTHFMPWLIRTFGFGRNDRFSMLSGLAHDPLQRDMFTPVCLGATLCIPDDTVIASGLLAGWMRDHQVTVSHLTPAMAWILTDCDAQGWNDHWLRLAFVTGDVLTTRDVTRLRRFSPDVSVVNFYGSTETQRGGRLVYG